MTKKDLQEYQYIKFEKNRIKEQVNQLKLSVYTPSTADTTKIRTLGGTYADKTATAVEQIEKLENKYKSILNDLVQKQLKIENAISDLPFEQRLIISYRYIDGMSWTAIQFKIPYSESHIYRLHSQALKALKDY